MLASPVLPVQITGFNEITGKGIEGSINNRKIKIGSKEFIDEKSTGLNASLTGEVYVSIDGIKKGCFKISNQYRDGVTEMISSLSSKGYDLHVLSGDNEAEKKNLELIFGKRATLLFYQSPQEKLNIVKRL